MLSYRHAFHAGNHADVLKHVVEVALIDHLKQKEAPFWYIDTHAGAGLYALDSAQASKLAEHLDGITRLWPAADAASPAKAIPEVIRHYLQVVHAANAANANHASSNLKCYPGSPWIAAHLLRSQDKLQLFELHGSDQPLLIQALRPLQLGRRVHVTAGDGFAGLKALLPPAPRRTLALIDPSFETAQDYRQVVDSLKDALARFATGIYMLWYPALSKPASRELPAQLKRLHPRWLHAALQVKSPAADGFGMHGSGVFILNPPWTLHAGLQEALPWLAQRLAQDDGAHFVLEQQLD